MVTAAGSSAFLGGPGQHGLHEVLFQSKTGQENPGRIGGMCCLLGGKADGKLWGWGEGNSPLYMPGTFDLLLCQCIY